MATIGRVNGASFVNTPRLSYYSTAAFNTYFYSYSTSINASLETIGTLSAVTGATASNCPAGRVLRENGRKLYPGANPGITTYMVGVYDAQTLLSGFIDPNAGVFQIYNTDKPTYLKDGVEPTLATTDRGPSIYTRGNVLGGGNLDISGSAHIYGAEQVDSGLTVHLGATIDNVAGTGLTVYNGETIASGDLLISTGNATISAGSLTVTNGKIYLDASIPNAIVGTASMADGSISGGFKRLTVSTTAVTSNSRVFLTLTGQNNVGVYSVENINAGASFQIVSSNTADASTLSWLIIN